MGDDLSPRPLGLHQSDVGIEINRGHRWIIRKLSHTTDNIRHEIWTSVCLKFLHQRRFEEGQLLKPDGIPDDQIQLFEANLGRPSVGRHRLTDDIAPLVLQAQFNQSRFKAEPFGQTG
jgi:hypothetical protein